MSRLSTHRVTALAVVLWQIVALVLGSVVLQATTKPTLVRTEPGTIACPVCEHQTTEGAACPMHAIAEAGDPQGGACVLTSGDNPAAELFTLIGSAGALVRPVEADGLVPVDPIFLPSILFLAGLSPLPSIPPPRA